VVAQVLADDVDVTVVVPGFTPPTLADAACSVVEVDPEVVHLERGCVCCALRWDLIDTLCRLSDRRQAPRRVVVLLDPDADLATAAQTLLGDSELRRRCVLDATVHVMDLRQLDPTLAGPLTCAPATDRSLAMADAVVLRGLATLGPEGAAALRRSLRVRAHGASLAVTPSAAAAVLDGRGANWTLDGAQRRLGHQHGTLLAEGGGGVRWMEASLPGTVDPDRLHDWLHELGEHPGEHLLRLEGIFCVQGEDRPWATLGVRTTIELGETERPHVANRTAAIRIVAASLDPVRVRDGLADCCV
jgi:G3E family GTPase